MSRPATRLTMIALMFRRSWPMTIVSFLLLGRRKELGLKRYAKRLTTPRKRLVTSQEVGFCCPQCKSALFRANSALHCSACANVYPINEGIFDFRCHRKNYYFNPVPRPAMAE